MEDTDGKPENRYGFVFDERVTPEVLATGDGYYLDGVLCNDDMNEMVFFAFKDGVRKE